MPAAKTPETRLFVARVRAGDQRALQKIETTLIRHGGNIEKTAAELGIGFQSLHRWGTDIEAVGKILDEYRRGRIGRGPSTKKKAKRKSNG